MIHLLTKFGGDNIICRSDNKMILPNEKQDSTCWSNSTSTISFKPIQRFLPMSEIDYTTRDKISTQKTFVNVSKNRPSKKKAGKQ